MSMNFCDGRPKRGRGHVGCSFGNHCFHKTGRTRKCSEPTRQTCGLRHPVMICCWCGERSVDEPEPVAHGKHRPKTEWSLDAQVAQARSYLRPKAKSGISYSDLLKIEKSAHKKFVRDLVRRLARVTLRVLGRRR